MYIYIYIHTCIYYSVLLYGIVIVWYSISRLQYISGGETTLENNKRWKRKQRWKTQRWKTQRRKRKRSTRIVRYEQRAGNTRVLFISYVCIYIYIYIYI